MKKMERPAVCAVVLAALLCLSGVTYSPLVQVVPGPGLPERVKCMDSNNNLDIVRFEGRLFLGFRTAPDHYAGRKTRLYIVSSTDEGRTWDYEAEVFMGSDMREPRFLALPGKLMFYFFQAGKNPLAFEPQAMFAMHRLSRGSWTQPEKIYEPGCIPWRAMEYQGKVYFTVHCGGAMFASSAEGSTPGVHFLTTTDGYNLEPVNPARRVPVREGGETAYAFDDDGALYLTLRSGGVAPESFGSAVCKATPADYSNWKCTPTKQSYASPFMFAQGGEIYLVARWNVDGDYDKGWRWMWDPLEALGYEARNWLTPKRTALYKLNKQSMKMEMQFLFPSKGDTAFPGMVKNPDGTWLLYNYSNDPDGFDHVWMTGQRGKTNIYSTILSFN